MFCLLHISPDAMFSNKYCPNHIKLRPQTQPPDKPEIANYIERHRAVTLLPLTIRLMLENRSFHEDFFSQPWVVLDLNQPIMLCFIEHWAGKNFTTLGRV